MERNTPYLFIYFHGTDKTLSCLIKLEIGAITELKKSVGWTIDKFRLNNSLVINDTILRFSYPKIDVPRRTFSNFWDFCCCKHQVIAV